MGYLWSQALFVLLFYTFNVLYVQAQDQTDGSSEVASASAIGDGNGNADFAPGDRETNALDLKAPSQITFCSTVDLTWANGQSPYEVYFARGTGAMDDESALGEEQSLGSINDPNFPWQATSLWSEFQVLSSATIDSCHGALMIFDLAAIPGDTIRLRVQDDQGHGINGTACS
jgi:hypothetical protein